MNEQTPIMKIIILVIIITAFCAAIYIIATVFATKCPAGQHFDTDQKKCILTCDDGQVYNPANNECRDVCTGNQVWSESLNICKDCGPGSSWNETSQECLLFCGSDGECTTGQSCINGQCCNYPVCKTKDGDKCCEVCTADPDNPGYSLCCAANKIYKDASGQTACCSAGQISDGSKCGVVCGPTGSTKICTPGNECLLIKNVDPKSSIFTQLNSNTDNSSEKNSDGTYNFYSCMGTKDMCNSQNAIASPPAVGNFYPCFDMGNNKPNDILSKNINDFNTELQKDQGYGYYCGDDKEDLSRLYRINFINKDKCNYTNCLAAMANPYVTDIQYDESTGNCTSLQSCTQNISGLNISGSNLNLGGQLPSCKNLPTDPNWICNSKEQLGGDYCEPGSGLIQRKGYNCVPENTVNGDSFDLVNNVCICKKPDAAGGKCEYTRVKTCSGHGIPNDDGTCKCDAFCQNAPAPVGCTLILTQEYFEKNLGYKSGIVYNWFSQFADTNTGQLKYTNQYGTLTSSDVSDNHVGWDYLYVMVLGVADKYKCEQWSATYLSTVMFTKNNQVYSFPPPVVPNSITQVFQSYANTDGNNFVNLFFTRNSDGSKFGFAIKNIKDSNTLTGPPNLGLPYKFYGAGTFYPASPGLLIIYGTKYLNGTN